MNVQLEGKCPSSQPRYDSQETVSKITNSEYLAETFTYHQAQKNCRYDWHILQGHLWGERFQVYGFERRQIIG